MKAKLPKSQHTASHKIGSFIIFCLILSSCSHKVVSESDTVARKDYEELEKKYNDLLVDKKSNSIPEINVETKGDELILSTSEEPLRPDLNDQMKMLDEIQEQIAKGKLDKASTSLKGIENSTFKQIRVRAKFYQAEIWFTQKEFDLALQIYDEIISKYGFSSIAVKAIERKEACKKNLNLPGKQEQYHSIFTDLINS